jgi:hypothetical protein
VVEGYNKNMKRLVAVCGLACLFPGLNAGWIKTYGEIYISGGCSVRQTTDGGYIITGTAPDSAAGPADALYDLWLVKTDSLGDTLWTRTYGKAPNEVGKCVQQTKDGGYIITGYRNGPTDPPPWPAGDLWLIKTDTNGDIEWDRVYGGSYYSSGNWVEQTSDGGYIVTGHYIEAYLWLLKTNESGYKVWEKLYDWGPGSQAGYCIRETSDGGYIITGMGGLLKTNENGDSIWLKQWGGQCVEQTSDEGYILTAHAGPGWGDIWIGKTNVDGDSLWARTYGGGTKKTLTVFSKQQMEGILFSEVLPLLEAGGY